MKQLKGSVAEFKKAAAEAATASTASTAAKPAGSGGDKNAKK